MTTREPTLSSLRLLVEVGRTQSLGKAARAHGISQPAASKQMVLLERSVGLQLLERRPVGSYLTEHGKVVAAWAATIVDAVDRLMGAVSSLAAATSSSLKVASSLTIAEHLVPGWLAALHTELPEVHVGLEVANSETVIRRVREGEAALGFVEGPDLDADLEHVTVARDRLVVVVAPGHPWASPDHRVDRALLLATPLVAREPGSGTRATLERSSPDVTPAPSLLELGSNEAVKGAVKAGVGPAVLSDFAVRGDLDHGLLVEVSVDDLDLTRNLVAVWSRSTRLNTSTRRLLEVIATAQAGSPGDRTAGSRP